MADDARDLLLEDAGLVHDYATRAGLLTDSALPKAIDDYRRAVARGESPDKVALSVALNKAVQAIVPMTLVDLRAGRSPFHPHNERVFGRRQLRLCSLTIAVLALIAFYTHALHREQAALEAYKQLQEVKPLDKLNAARKMVQFGGALDKSDRNYDFYHQLVNEWVVMQERISANQALIVEASNSPTWPFQNAVEGAWAWANALPATVQTFVRSAKANERKAADDASPDDGVALSTASGKSKAPAVIPSTATGLATGVTAPDECATDNGVDFVDLGKLKSYPAWLQKVLGDVLSDFCFSVKLLPGGSAAGTYQPTAVFIPSIQQRVEVYNAWVLPFLYGVLGATVFLMRSLINARTPNIEVPAAVMRIALGGVAGIVIGWFWAPVSASNSGASAISSVPYGLAFLTGFGIDMLFGLLDRLLQTLTSPPQPAPKS